jgi:ribose transport system ATP-binding protein
LSKRFYGIYALKDVSLQFESSSIHALLGENGAGKSTLCKILSGAIQPDSGNIRIGDKVWQGFSPDSAKKSGIGMVYQEFNLVPEMTVYENLFLGKEIKKGIHLDKRGMIKKTAAAFKKFSVDIDPTARVSSLSVAYCQLVEIAKALMEEVSYLILDEPTAALTNQEVEALFSVVRELKNMGVTIIYISHRIEELLELADCVTVMRDGEIITTLQTSGTDRNELIKLMVGRELGAEFDTRKTDFANAKDSKVCISVRNLTTSAVNNISFDVYRGEIFGIAGLAGSGRTETVRALFGADRKQSGEVLVDGEPVNISSPKSGIKHGIAYIPEDRKLQGINLNMSIGDNLSLIKIKALCRALTISSARERELIDKYVKILSIKMSTVDALISSLSGGNQQKVVLSKWLSTEADVLLLDEPTRGIDVGAKKEIYDIMRNLSKQGKAIVMISSEMLEVVGMCDRVIVLQEGDMRGELKGEAITQENILQLASGGELVS